MEKYTVYIKTDDKGLIIAVNSDAFLPSTDGWEKVAQGHGDKFHHAQGNYLPGPLMDDDGIYRYKLVDGAAVERTQDEMDGDYVPPVQSSSIETRVEQVESKTAELEESLDMLLAGVTGDE